MKDYFGGNVGVCCTNTRLSEQSGEKMAHQLRACHNALYSQLQFLHYSSPIDYSYLCICGTSKCFPKTHFLKPSKRVKQHTKVSQKHMHQMQTQSKWPSIHRISLLSKRQRTCDIKDGSPHLS